MSCWPSLAKSRARSARPAAGRSGAGSFASQTIRSAPCRLPARRRPALLRVGEDAALVVVPAALLQRLHAHRRWRTDPLRMQVEHLIEAGVPVRGQSDVDPERIAAA